MEESDFASQIFGGYMALKIEDKKLIVEEIAGIAAGAGSMVAAEYRGLTVAQLTELRSKAREANVQIRVVKNTLARIAVKDTKFEDMADTFTGPLVYAWSGEELGNAARVFKDFAKTNEDLVVRSLSIGEGVMDAGQLNAVAALPTYDEAVAKLLFVMKEPVAKLARALTAVKEQKEEAA